ncbi:MAG TPA: class I SAM-dependent methyltransferase, partial [Dehalococcoidia bacterium]|nr:class I SAM-dependent methyltransferase [Dehalococcoidia bacterium]
MVTTATTTAPDLAQQGAKILGHYSGYVATWTIDLGLRTGLWQALTDRPQGATAEQVAAQLGLDPLYTRVWCRSAYAAGLLELDAGGSYTLAPHLDTLLLNSDAPGYLGGLGQVMVALRDTFQDLRGFIKTGEREWWSDMTPEFIAAVGDAGQAFYRRMINGVVPQLPAVRERLEAGTRVLDLACGTCNGPIKFARAYPQTTYLAVDGDAYTIEYARRNLEGQGLLDRFELVQSPLEELAIENSSDIAII